MIEHSPSYKDLSSITFFIGVMSDLCSAHWLRAPFTSLLSVLAPGSTHSKLLLSFYFAPGMSESAEPHPTRDGTAWLDLQLMAHLVTGVTFEVQLVVSQAGLVARNDWD